MATSGVIRLQRPSASRVPPPDSRVEYRLPGEGQLQIWMRCYAPFKTFGGGYGGDDRQASTDTRDSARIAYVYTFDVASMKQVGAANAFCHRSHGAGIFPQIMARTSLKAQVTHDGAIVGQAIATSRTTVQPTGRPGSGFVLNVELAASNPLVGMAADIDAQLNVKVFRARENVLGIGGNLTGDAFPNCEVFVRDASDETVMLHVFRTGGGGETGPYEYLPGNNTRPMGSFNRNVRMLKSGLIAE